MNKNLLLEYLELDDLEPYADLHDIGAESGLGIIKELYLKHEGCNIYVPKLSSNKRLNERYIKEHRHQFTEHQLARDVGWRVDMVRQVLYKKK